MRTPLWLVLAVSLVSLPARAVQVGVDVAPALAPSVAGPLSFQVDAAGLAQSYQDAKAIYEGELARIAAIPADQRTFQNTIVAMEQADAAFSEEGNRIGLLANVAPDEATRKQAQSLEEDMSRVGIETVSREDLYNAVKQYADKGEALQGEDKLLLENTLRGFKSAGHGLAPEAKTRLMELSKRLSKLSSDFGNNINESQGGMDLTVDQLKGLPADMIERLQKAAAKAGRTDGKVHVSLDYTDYRPFMKYAEDGDLRRQLELQFNNRAADKNTAILPEVLKIRDEIAKIRLGPDATYPDLALENRMAETPRRVWDFYSRLRPALTKRGISELDLLLDAKRKHIDPNAARVESWERDYLGQKVIKERFDLDPQKVKEYFPVERVVAGTMQVYERVLGIKFTEVANPDVWHPEVKLYRINDADTGDEVGYIYLDLFPRPGKYKHAAAFGVIPGRVLPSGEYRKPVAAMIANLAVPSEGKPALLTHDNVETYFHEFGHLMHQTLTKAKYASMAGTAVKRDFVELPSQMLENFVWEREVLDMISGNEKGEKLPDELFQKMLGAQSYMDYGMGLFYLRQVALGMVDMLYHTAIPMNTTELFNQTMESVGLLPVQPGSRFEASFGHLMGYASGYYGYAWSLVFADDAWTRFAKEGIFNPKVGRAWRDEVLARGSTRPEIDSLRAFLGREPSEQAFMDNMSGEPQVDPETAKRTALIAEHEDALAQLMDIPAVLDFSLDIRGAEPTWYIEIAAEADASRVARAIARIEPQLKGKLVIMPAAPEQ